MRFIVLISMVTGFARGGFGADFQRDVRPVLERYCVKCHSGAEARGDIDLRQLAQAEDVAETFETWEAVAGHLQARTMPPEEEAQPTDAERNRVSQWYQQFLESIEARPMVFQPRRLSVKEYRNTLRSVLGFDLEVAIIEAEQTLSERSMVIKLLPTDPPGRSGFTNDTHRNPLTTVVWDQYSYLIDAGLEQLFSPERREQLVALVGPMTDDMLTDEQAHRLLRRFVARAWRRPVDETVLAKFTKHLAHESEASLTSALKFEMKTILMSPAFIYRGVLITGRRGERQQVDRFELAERLSCFLWADMPDERLRSAAANGTLTNPGVLNAEVDRMLTSPRARALAEIFAAEWLTLNEIEHVSNNPPQMVALKSQPIDFMHYLFTEDRPLLELVDSHTAFISPHTAGMYGRDAGQMTKYVKPQGIEVEIVPNQKIRLEQAAERGGILTMPGVLAMNKGPIQRGTWILERILGEELPEPPANVGQVPPNSQGEDLSFRERFEQHRSNASCAVCHDRIDPLGFALESFDSRGHYLSASSKVSRRERKKNSQAKPSRSAPDTSGRLPSGEEFDDIAGLKQILVTSQRRQVIRNIVERTLAYALCRKLEVFDRPTVDMLVEQMDRSDATWRQLFHAIVGSVPFQEMILSARSETPTNSSE